MAHGQIRATVLPTSGTTTIQVPLNAVIEGVTTVGNSPAVIIRSHDPFMTDTQPYVMHIYSLGAGETVGGPDNTDFIGLATTGNRCWAVFKNMY